MHIRLMESYILEALAVFQYLTSRQLIRLLPSTSLSSINRYLRNLKNADRPLIRALHFGFAPWKWPLAPVYCLTDRWAKRLTTKLNYARENIKRPLSRSCFFAADYYHRIATIDFKISMFRYIQKQWYILNFYHCYFEREGSNHSHTWLLSKSKTALKEDDIQIIPDAIIGYTTPTWSELILFEQHMGNDSKRAIQQIMWHCRLLSKWVVNKKYGSKKNAQVYYVFENKSCMEAVKKRLQQVSGFSEFEPYFWMKTMDEDLSLLWLC